MRISAIRRIVGVVAVAALGVLPLTLLGPAAAAAKPGSATFNPNLLLQGSTNTAEPSIRTDRFGRSFVIGPTGVPAGCKAWRVTHDGSSATYIGQPDHTAGGGDCDWAIGPQETSATISPAPTDDDLAYSSLSLANITTGKSDDGGNSFGPPNVYSQQVGGDDRMWMAADPRLNALGFANIFMTYHDVGGPQDIQLGVSIDGGFSYVQNAPIINNSDVPPEQWHGSGAGFVGDGNELGNIVARRTASGLTLYSIFETPDSPADNTAQALAGTANYNRVYEAVGTVTADTAPPVISWRNYEIYHGPLGARYDRIFPVTAVENAGRVYAFWSDGNHIDYKVDATGTGWRPSKAPSRITNPSRVNTAIIPCAQAGAPGTAVVYFTRQCTGTSATTGSALVNDCVAPAPVPPPPQGTTCPGPQVVDYVGDAPNNYPGGDGSNIDNLDVVNAFFGTPSSSDVQVTLTIKDLVAPPPPVNLVSAFWTVYWTFSGTTYFAQATSNGAVVTYSDGTFSGGNFNTTNVITGSFNPGPDGTIVFTVPRADVGSPADGATLSSPFADSHGSVTIHGCGVYYTSAADRAPDSGFGANYVVGQVCSP